MYRIYTGEGSQTMRLRNLGSNQTEIEIGTTTVFFSYETPVAAFVPSEGFVRTEKRHSVTTQRHINKWLDGREATKRPQVFFDTLVIAKYL